MIGAKRLFYDHPSPAAEAYGTSVEHSPIAAISCRPSATRQGPMARKRPSPSNEQMRHTKAIHSKIMGSAPTGRTGARVDTIYTQCCVYIRRTQTGRASTVLYSPLTHKYTSETLQADFRSLAKGQPSASFVYNAECSVLTVR